MTHQSALPPGPWRKVEDLPARPWISYLAVSLLQLKIVWGAWAYRDLTSGDTASYFLMAEMWRDSFTVNIMWSPLYTAFYGTLLHLTPDDAYLPTILHRLVIVFAVTLLVLAVMRRLLTPGLALVVAAWWAMLPVTYETAYEVHLFAAIPMLVAWLVILRRPGPWSRGAALAILAAAIILVRNELVLAVVVLAGFCLVAEVRARRGRTDQPHVPWGSVVAAYGVPLALAGAVCAFFYSRSMVQFPQLPARYAPKHTLNMCQVYAFGYKQRHTDWTLDHWTQCGALMEKVFGEPLPSLGTMMRRNPRAVEEHFLWNAGLIGNGVQLLLFNATSGTITPDYGAVRSGSRIAGAASAVAIAVFVAGLVVALANRRYWWEHWLRDRMWGWLAILAMAPVWVVIILTQRPRPSYLFSLGLACMAALGTSVLVLGRRPDSTISRLTAPLSLAVVAALIVVVPPSYMRVPAPRRPLLDLYRRLKPFQDVVARRDTVFLVSGWAFELRYYLGRYQPEVMDYGVLGPGPPAERLNAFLDQSRVNLVYADEALVASLRGVPDFRPLLDSTATSDWLLIGYEEHAAARWRLWRSRGSIAGDPAEAARLGAALDIVRGFARSALSADRSRADITLGSGWYAPETQGGQVFRWVTNDAEVVVVAAPAGRRLVLDLEPGPGARSLPLAIQVRDRNGRTLRSFAVDRRETVTLPAGSPRNEATALILHTDGGGRTFPSDPRTLNFRVFAVGWSPAE